MLAGPSPGGAFCVGAKRYGTGFAYMLGERPARQADLVCIVLKHLLRPDISYVITRIFGSTHGRLQSYSPLRFCCAVLAEIGSSVHDYA
jgi:hypothetical protein